MSNNTVVKQHVQMAKVFSQVELEERQREAESRYMEGYYSSTEYSVSWHYPARELVSFNSPRLMLEGVVEMTKAGRELYPFAGDHHLSDTLCQVGFYKPQAEIDADLVEVYAKAEGDYRQEIEAHNTAQVALLAEQLYQAEQIKIEKAELKKNEEMKAKALATAQAHIQSQLKEAV